MNIKKLLLYQLLGLIIITAIVSIWSFQMFIPSFQWTHDPLRSTINAIGVMIAIIASVVFFLQAKKNKNRKLYLIAMGLISIGLLGGFAGTIFEGNQAIFIRSMGTLLGSGWFVLVLIPDSEKYFIENKWIPYFTAALSIIFGLWALLFPDAIPLMIQGGGFTKLAVGMNLLSGALFLLSATYFIGQFHRNVNIDSYLISTICLLFGLSRIAFKFSFNYSAVWWFWQSLQLAAYLVAGVLVVRWYRNILLDLSFVAVENERINEVLYKSKEWTRLIIDTAYEAFVSLDANGLIIDWNTQAEKTFGWTRNEVLGQKMTNTIIPEGLRESYEKSFKNYLFKGEEGPFLNKRFEIKMIHRHGHEFPVEATIRPIKLGNIFTFNIFLHDITERKKAEKELSMSEARYRLLSQNTTELICLYNSEGVCLYVSPASRKLLGYESNDIIGHLIFEFFHTEDIDKSIYQRLLNLPGIHTASFRHKSSEGSYLWLEGTVRVLHHTNTSSMKQIIIVAHKIDEQKESELKFPLLSYLGKTNEFELKRKPKLFPDGTDKPV